jgi:hypothetical protein
MHSKHFQKEHFQKESESITPKEEMFGEEAD